MPRSSALTVRWAWPSRRRVAFVVPLYGMLGVLFAVVYFGANWWASQRTSVAYLHAPWEREIPFVPGAIVVYFSISLVFAMPAFALDERGLRAMARAFAACTLAAGICFLLLPFRIGFDRPASVAGFDAIYATLYRFDAPFNTVPSLHIAYSTLILLALAWASPAAWARLSLAAWWLAICASVLLVHQHHVVDVLSGAALGAACCWRWLLRRPPRA